MKVVLNILFFVVLVSCSNKQKTEQYHSFNENTWNTDSIVLFDIHNKDSISPHNIVLTVRHSTEYKFQNLYVFTNFQGALDTTELMLSEKNGKWLGTGFGDIRELDFVLMTNVFFDNNSENKISIEQAMRYGLNSKIENLEGVVAVGISTYKTNE